MCRLLSSLALGLLIAVASFVEERGLQGHVGSVVAAPSRVQAQLSQSMDLVAQQHVGSSCSRD